MRPRPFDPFSARMQAKRVAEWSGERERRNVAPPLDAQYNDIGRAVHAWKQLKAFVLELIGLATFAVGFAVAAFAAYLLWKATFEEQIAIAPINVPRELADRGYTAEVAAGRLQASLNEMMRKAGSVKIKKRQILDHALNEKGDIDFPHAMDFTLAGRQPDIIVPGVGMPIETLAKKIRNVFSIGKHADISGDIILDSDRTISLRIHINETELDIPDAKSVDISRSNEIFNPAIKIILEVIAPLNLAAAIADDDPDGSLKIASKIIDDNTENSKNLQNAHILKGAIYLRRQNIDESISEFKESININNRSSAAYKGLAFSFFEKKKQKKRESTY